MSSSAGRLFDAVSALLGGRAEITYEGQVAMEAGAEAEPFPFRLTEGEPLEIDSRPLIHAVVEEVLKGSEAALIALRFHVTLAEIIADVCRALRERTGVKTAALSGGVFMNRLLWRLAERRLIEEGFLVVGNRQVPCNDGGLSFGQLAVVAAGGGKKLCA